MLVKRIALLLAISITTVTAHSTTAATNRSTETGLELESALKLAHLPSPLQLADTKKDSAATENWKAEKDADGTELLTHKNDPETRVAVMHEGNGPVEAIVSYSLEPTEKKKETTVRPEKATGLFFKKSRLAAFTSCEDKAEKNGLGRICVTATENLCQGLRSGKGVTAEALKEMDAFEMRALASILTLRGSDHQLDNLLRAGNRLGLKSGLQTTRGQLIALAAQIQKELKKEPASEANKENSTLARAVLEKSIPQLKENCLAAKF